MQDTKEGAAPKEPPPDKVAALKQIRDEFKGNGSDTQRQRLRTAFERFPSVSTIEARTCLDILHPAGRIQELREEGQKIVTHWVTVETGARAKHRIANYLLVREVCHA